VRIFTFILLACHGLLTFSQEISCRVVIDHTQVQVSDPSVFDKMEVDITEFINNRRWTNDQYQLEERINCNILMTITSVPTSGNYQATAQILSSRPVYGTDYETVVFNFADRDWEFSYIPSRPINYNENAFTDNLSSLLSFYAHVIIGMDYDTFGELAGTPHYQEAFRVVNNAQSANFRGWQQLGSNRNRYWLIENLQSQALQPVRLALYQYHRHGLDIFSEEPDDARNTIAEALQGIQGANRSRPRAILTISFMDAKATELAQIFSSGSSTVRKKAYGIVTAIDPSKTDIFKPMVE
jgi:hypothetical protein